jgi:hypothetical protein
LAGLGAIAGFAVGDACVTTRCTILQNAYPLQERVEVDVLGKRVSDETGFAPRQWIPAVSGPQATWVYGPLAVGAGVGAVVGLIAAWSIARRLVGPAVDAVHAGSHADAAGPDERAVSSDQIEPALRNRSVQRGFGHE